MRNLYNSEFGWDSGGEEDEKGLGKNGGVGGVRVRILELTRVQEGD